MPETNTFQHTFDVDLALPPAPTPVTVCCGREVFPFVIASDRLMDEDGQIEGWFEWYRRVVPAEWYRQQTTVLNGAGPRPPTRG